MGMELAKIIKDLTIGSMEYIYFNLIANTLYSVFHAVIWNVLLLSNMIIEISLDK